MTCSFGQNHTVSVPVLLSVLITLIHIMKSAAGVALPQMGQANLALTSMHYMVGAFKLFSYWVKNPKDEVNRSPDR